MKKNLLYISIIALLLLLVVALVIIILQLYNKPKIILSQPVIVKEEIIEEEANPESKPEVKPEPQYPEFLKYGVKPKEAKYYE